MRFSNRSQAGRQLGQAVRKLNLERPVVLGLPRGGVVTALEVARELGAELDVVLVRKLRAPQNPELAIGALSEGGQVFLLPYAQNMSTPEYLEAEIQYQKDVLLKRSQLYRKVRPQVPLAGRNVILVDDGIATGSTMEAALESVLSQAPARVVVAVPVAPAEAAQKFGARAEFFALDLPEYFGAVGAFYQDFPQVEDQEVISLLKTNTGPGV